MEIADPQRKRRKPPFLSCTDEDRSHRFLPFLPFKTPCLIGKVLPVGRIFFNLLFPAGLPLFAADTPEPSKRLRTVFSQRRQEDFFFRLPSSFPLSFFRNCGRGRMFAPPLSSAKACFLRRVSEDRNVVGFRPLLAWRRIERTFFSRSSVRINHPLFLYLMF